MFTGNKLGAMLLVKAVGTLFVTRTCFVKNNKPERKRWKQEALLTLWDCEAGRERLRWKRKSWQAKLDPPRAWSDTWKPRRKAIPKSNTKRTEFIQPHRVSITQLACWYFIVKYMCVLQCATCSSHGQFMFQQERVHLSYQQQWSNRLSLKHSHNVKHRVSPFSTLNLFHLK